MFFLNYLKLFFYSKVNVYFSFKLVFLETFLNPQKTLIIKNGHYFNDIPYQIKVD